MHFQAQVQTSTGMLIRSGVEVRQHCRLGSELMRWLTWNTTRARIDLWPLRMPQKVNPGLVWMLGESTTVAPKGNGTRVALSSERSGCTKRKVL